jgi:hypothetical protein
MKLLTSGKGQYGSDRIKGQLGVIIPNGSFLIVMPNVVAYLKKAMHHSRGMLGFFFFFVFILKNKNKIK